MPTILIIEHSKIVRKLLKQECRSEGYKTISAKSGEQGLNLLREYSIDLVITSIVLPGISGDELIEQMKNTPSLSAIPILVISGETAQENVVRCIKLGAEDLLSKPFVSEVLQARIGSCLEKAELRRKELKMYAEMAAEKCSQEMVGAICHNFNQALTTGMCNLDILKRLVKKLMGHCEYVHSNLGKDIQQKLTRFSQEYCCSLQSKFTKDEIFEGLSQSINDTGVSLQRIDELIIKMRSLVRPTAVDYVGDKMIIDFDKSMKQTILLVAEDNNSLCSYIEEVAIYGYQICSALSSKEAVQKAYYNQPHLIVVELRAGGEAKFAELFNLKRSGELKMPILLVLADNAQAFESRVQDDIAVVAQVVTSADIAESGKIVGYIETLLLEEVEI